MATSPYFRHDREDSEQSLFDDLSVETIQLAGVDVHYIPYTKSVDRILGESSLTTFDSLVTIEAFMPDGGNVSGEGEIMTKFGFAQRDRLEITINRGRWQAEVKRKGLDLVRPREGDLVFIGDINKPYKSQVNQMFEITHVEFGDSSWSFGKRFNYKIALASWMSSHERFSTGTKIDEVVANDIIPDMTDAINNAVQTTKQVIIQPGKKSPLSNI